MRGWKGQGSGFSQPKDTIPIQLFTDVTIYEESLFSLPFASCFGLSLFDHWASVLSRDAPHRCSRSPMGRDLPLTCKFWVLHSARLIDWVCGAQLHTTRTVFYYARKSTEGLGPDSYNPFALAHQLRLDRGCNCLGTTLRHDIHTLPLC